MIWTGFPPGSGSKSLKVLRTLSAKMIRIRADQYSKPWFRVYPCILLHFLGLDFLNDPYISTNVKYLKSSANASEFSYSPDLSLVSSFSSCRGGLQTRLRLEGFKEGTSVLEGEWGGDRERGVSGLSREWGGEWKDMGGEWVRCDEKWEGRECVAEL